jgi:chromosome segregation ATPase
VIADAPIRQARAGDYERPNSDVDEAFALIEELEAMLRNKADVAENGTLALAAAQERHRRLEQRGRDLEQEIQTLNESIAAVAGRIEMCETDSDEARVARPRPDVQ